MTQTQSQRMTMIRAAHKRFNTKLKRNQRVRKTETKTVDPLANVKDTTNINHYTDASKYANQYYGDVYRETTRFDNDWD